MSFYSRNKPREIQQDISFWNNVYPTQLHVRQQFVFTVSTSTKSSLTYGNTMNQFTAEEFVPRTSLQQTRVNHVTLSIGPHVPTYYDYTTPLHMGFHLVLTSQREKKEKLRGKL
jgi:hypothetical protein